MVKSALFISVAVGALAIGSGLPARAVDFNNDAYGWTGFYIGAYGGGGGIVGDINIPEVPGSSFSGLGGQGLIGGGLLGWNYQVTPNVVLGIQGEVGTTSMETTLNLDNLLTASAHPDWTAAVSARFGYAFTPSTMLYFIGGYSYAHYVGDVPVLGISGSEDYNGWHAGAGIETKLTRNLTARLEYRYTAYDEGDWGTHGIFHDQPASQAGTIAIAWSPGFGGPSPAPVDYGNGWTGLYLGGFAGGGASVTNIELPFLSSNFDGIGSDGFHGGGVVGLNYQMSPSIVVGVQGDIAGDGFDSDLHIANTLIATAPRPDWTASASARVGFAVVPSTLIYVIGGYSHGDYVATIPILGRSASQGYDGWHIGAGVETKLARNLTARLEYRYTDFSGEDWGSGGLVNIEPALHTGTIGLNWLIN